MKYLTMSAAALFLLAAPVTGFAQNQDNGGGNQAGGGGSNTHQQTGGEDQCNDETASSSYDSFSEKCRHQIDAWAMSQAGKGKEFKGELAVGATVPEDVEIVEVPAYHHYGYVMLNDHRVLVDRTTRKVIRVY